MSLVSQLKKDGFARHWLKKHLPFHPRLMFIEEPIEETDWKNEKRRRRGLGEGPAEFHAMDAYSAASANERRDDNYLYATRRYPGNTANNTIGSGALTSGPNSYFTAGVGDTGSQAGYFSLTSLTYQQTNMGPKGQIPKGMAYRLREVGIAFNANAKVADVQALLDCSALSFNKQGGGYLIYHGPIALWPGGTGPYGFAAAATTVAATTVNTQAATNGAPTLGGIRQLTHTRDFSPADMFEYTLTQTATLPADNSTVALSAFTEIRVQLFGTYYSAITD